MFVGGSWATPSDTTPQFPRALTVTASGVSIVPLSLVVTRPVHQLLEHVHTHAWEDPGKELDGALLAGWPHVGSSGCLQSGLVMAQWAAAKRSKDAALPRPSAVPATPRTGDLLVLPEGDESASAIHISDPTLSLREVIETVLCTLDPGHKLVEKLQVGKVWGPRGMTLWADEVARYEGRLNMTVAELLVECGGLRSVDLPVDGVVFEYPLGFELSCDGGDVFHPPVHVQVVDVE